MTGKQPKRKPRPGVDAYGRTGLHNAVVHGSRESVEALLAAGADVNAQDDNGMTPLLFAAQESRADLIDLLLAQGADPNLVDRHGNGPLFRAVFNFNARKDDSIIAALVRAGADPGLTNKSGTTPRSLAELMGLKIF